MELVSQFSRRSFLMIVLVMAVLLLLVDIAFYYGVEEVFSQVTITSKTDGSSVKITGIVDNLIALQQTMRLYFVPLSALGFALAGFLLWLALRVSLSRLLKGTGATLPDKAAASTPVDPKAKEEEADRMFLHMLAAFQRDGRLVDFFSEDLAPYEDAQIGAAVRNIHDGCQSTLKKYLALEPVIDSEEGETVTVEEGFDPAAVKLTGNVTGSPPFKGVLRHRGWRVSKLERPKLAGGAAARVIAPAEIEIGQGR